MFHQGFSLLEYDSFYIRNSLQRAHDL